VGTSHAATGAPCQDHGRCEVFRAEDGMEVLVAAVSDGAGSAARSEEGSCIAVERFLDAFGSLATEDPSLSGVGHPQMLEWAVGLREAIQERAEESGARAADFACTLLGGVVGPDRAVFVQIGDGAIVARDGESADLGWIFWPQHGEFANTTNFVTQDGFEQALEVEIVEQSLLEIAMFSDGIERLVLDLSAKTVHSPALRPILDWLASTDAATHASDPAPGLVAFLGSSRVNERTDDDKTLVVASRAVPEPARQ
jgi:hypothetical protein